MERGTRTAARIAGILAPVSVFPLLAWHAATVQARLGPRFFNPAAAVVPLQSNQTPAVHLFGATLIAIPVVVILASWIGRARRGHAAMRTPDLWAFAVLVLAAMNIAPGIGLIRADSGAALHDTYYVVAHFGYALRVCAVFAIFAALYFWLPKITGRAYREGIGQLHFWLTFAGVTLMFLPMTFLTIAGMPRHLADLPDMFAAANRISSVGAAIALLGILVFVVVLIDALVRPRPRAEAPG